MLTQARLKEVLRYEPDSGVFYWAGSRKGVKTEKGLVAGCVAEYGAARYIKIRVDRKLYFAHRLAWFWTHGEWPDPEVDHINRNGLDNRLSNLRLATSTQNKANRIVRNPTGFKGVIKRGNRWIAQCKGYLGSFDTPEEAAAAFDSATIVRHRPYALTNERMGLL